MQTAELPGQRKLNVFNKPFITLIKLKCHIVCEKVSE
uniref:Uncharacterized protein n=1 Tax=Anguilla anguilla TaxID=7936 RepID=A0A0E9T1N5_ANGAN